MEIELKYRLTQHSYQKLKNLLQKLPSCKQISIDNQCNYFLDSNKELESLRSTFRLRRIDNGTKKSFLTLKGNFNATSVVSIKDGLFKNQELEQELENNDFDEIIKDPKKVLDFRQKYKYLDVVLTHLKTHDIVNSGMFKNNRLVYDWNNLKLELDETLYDFGTGYELEVETPEAEKVRVLLENLFKDNEIEYSYSKRSKFGKYLSTHPGHLNKTKLRQFQSWFHHLINKI